MGKGKENEHFISGSRGFADGGVSEHAGARYERKEILNQACLTTGRFRMTPSIGGRSPLGAVLLNFLPVGRQGFSISYYQVNGFLLDYFYLWIKVVICNLIKLIIMEQAWIYIISNQKRTTLYIGVTNNLERRILEHKAGLGSDFASKYGLSMLLYFEPMPDISIAIDREKQLKNWHRDWKLNLIRKMNPEMKDLSIDWYSRDDIIEFINNQDYIEKTGKGCKRS